MGRRDEVPSGLLAELRRRGYDVDDKSPAEILELFNKGKLRKVGSERPASLPKVLKNG